MRIISVVLMLLFSLLAVAQESSLFENATKAYNEGNYDKAIENYLKILGQGQHSPELYYNLGNSYYKMNKVAPSIYYYEKALLLSPNDPEIKNNLAYAQNMTLDAIQQVPETTFGKFYNEITGILSFDQWAYVAVLFMLLFAIAYIAFYYLRYATQKRIAFITSLAFIVVAVVAIALAYVQYADFNRSAPAIVFSEEVIVKSEPNDSGQEVFTLHEGTKVTIIDALDTWQRIRIADGKTGWLPKESVKAIKDFNHSLTEEK